VETISRSVENLQRQAGLVAEARAVAGIKLSRVTEQAQEIPGRFRLGGFFDQARDTATVCAWDASHVIEQALDTGKILAADIFKSYVQGDQRS